MLTDPIADMLTRIRNAVAAGKSYLDVPSNKVKIAIAEVLQREGFIGAFELLERPVQNDVRIHLKYGSKGESVIRRIERVSKPGKRVYSSCGELKPVLRGLGVAVVSTSKGVMSDAEARKAQVGGEILCKVW